MTFGVVEREEPLLAERIALAFESAGHDCLVFESIDEATRILHAIKLDSIVLGIHMPGRSTLEWLETMVTIWPDLPSRTLLLTNTALTGEEEARIENLGTEVGLRPSSLVGVERVVRERVNKAWSERAGRFRQGRVQEVSPSIFPPPQRWGH